MNLADFQFYQIAVVAISLIMIGLGLEKFFKREPSQSLLKLLVRLIVWGGMAAVALFPSFTNSIAAFIGLEGNINAVVLIGFLLVFAIVFKILSVVERIERDISVLAKESIQKKGKL